MQYRSGRSSETQAEKDKEGAATVVGAAELKFHEAVRDIYGSANANGHLLNDDIVFAAFENDKATILTADEDTHARFRRGFAQFFARQNLTAFEPLFNKYSALLVRRLETTEQNAFDIAELFSFTVFDVMGHLLFGQSLQLLEKSGCIDWARGQTGWIRASVTAASPSSIKHSDWSMFLICIRSQKKKYLQKGFANSPKWTKYFLPTVALKQMTSWCPLSTSST